MKGQTDRQTDKPNRRTLHKLWVIFTTCEFLYSKFVATTVFPYSKMA